MDWTVMLAVLLTALVVLAFRPRKKQQQPITCARCGFSAVNLPRLTFNFLDGRPSVCERCVAESYGIEKQFIKRKFLNV